ncbi:hypothetical protein L228DRAFT_17958 [Xylona heveae TC161]|uniref:Enhancer of mRNA-decapping protein 3 n=1 Tax=Xylona heveae (strain CBS 132557 / TC161) TaxID=1328760 RepID=A0A165JXD7_XYLHT|nr:hypothetical protein L228DRAFT_17958 [Xylona heveae TC161]KZF26743.1 hypothetical protein L228DRAFT_17958 [Xylona heveae TC161]
MAADFIGVNVFLTLKHPPNTQLEGLVADVAGQQLTLRDVYVPSLRQHFQEYRVEGSEIEDLEVAPRGRASIQSHPPTVLPQQTSTPAGPPASRHAPVPHASTVHQVPHGAPLAPLSVQIPKAAAAPQPKPFVDPAILSFSKRPEPATSSPIVPAHQHASHTPSELLGTPVHATPSPTAFQSVARPYAGAGQAQENLPTRTSAMSRQAGLLAGGNASPALSNQISVQDMVRKAAPQRALSSKTNDVESPVGIANSLNGLDINGTAGGFDHAANPSTTSGFAGSVPAKRDTSSKRPKKNGRVNIRKESVIPNDPSIVNVIETTTAASEDGDFKSTGWRQTSFTETIDVSEKPSLGPLSGSTPRSAKKRNRRKPKKNMDETDGWATEEATDIQGMGEFDFAGNLSKFDKRSVFDQIRNEDTTADEDRLVSFNKIQAKPLTAGGKNYHPTENVLDRPKSDGFDDWDSDSLSEEDEVTDEVEDPGIRSGSRSSRRMRRLSSRKGSAAIPASISSSHLPPRSLSNRGHYSSPHGATTGSPRPGSGRGRSPSASPFPLGAAAKLSLHISDSNRSCPTVSPLQMLEVEQVAEQELGLSEDMVAENAARGIAEVALSILSPGGKRLAAQYDNHNASPVAVVLAGNHKSGARAIASGRHLRNHGVRVVCCVIGLERESELLDSVRRQLNIFRKMGGKVTRSERLHARLKALDAPPELIIDAMLGVHIPFDELRADDQAVAFEFIQWANRSKASVLSVDIPTGIDGSTGKSFSFFSPHASKMSTETVTDITLF